VTAPPQAETAVGTSSVDADDTDEARVVLLTVDDDASVSRAVARDLRRRYGE
jgi:CHASE2 domain-containing sensor protein